jgi:hypothetical protein
MPALIVTIGCDDEVLPAGFSVGVNATVTGYPVVGGAFALAAWILSPPPRPTLTPKRSRARSCAKGRPPCALRK